MGDGDGVGDGWLSAEGSDKERDGDHDTHNETSCFHTGLWADLGAEPRTPLVFDERRDFVEDCELGTRPFGVTEPLRLSTEPLLTIALREARAVEEEFRDKVVATPLASFSVSSVGSLETNSFCSNWTTM